MKDTNLSLRQAYYERINGNITIRGAVVPLYNMLVPEGYPPCYIVINSVINTGRETKDTQDIQTGITFTISTRYDNNSGWECDQIASQLYQLVYPDRQTIIPGCLSMNLVTDMTVADYDASAKKQIIERNIIFNHIITKNF